MALILLEAALLQVCCRSEWLAARSYQPERTQWQGLEEEVSQWLIASMTMAFQPLRVERGD